MWLLSQAAGTCPKKSGAKDPYGGKGGEVDKKKIIKCIMLILCEEEIKKMAKDRAKDGKMSLEDILGLFSCDVMNSMHLRIGNPGIGDKKLKSNEQYIFLYDKIDKFHGGELGTIGNEGKLFKKALDFFNCYHTLGNFLIIPSEMITLFGKNGNEVSRSFNQQKRSNKKDDFGAFIELLERKWPNNSGSEKSQKKEEVKERTENAEKDIWEKLFEANGNFFDGFGSFGNYCKKNCLSEDILDFYEEIQKQLNQLVNKKNDKNNENEKIIEFYMDACRLVIRYRSMKMLCRLWERLKEKEKDDLKNS